MMHRLRNRTGLGVFNFGKLYQPPVNVLFLRIEKVVGQAHAIAIVPGVSRLGTVGSPTRMMEATKNLPAIVGSPALIAIGLH
jgi:hypothetical protein